MKNQIVSNELYNFIKLIPGRTLISSLIILAFSCTQPYIGITDYSKLQFDTSRIAILQWDTSQISPNNSDPLPLTQEDLIVIDSLLKDGIDSFNYSISPGLYSAFGGRVSLDSFIIHYDKYKYQYLPSRDVNGQKIVLIIGFSNPFSKWKSKVYSSPLHYGMRKMELQINLTEKSRDNIRSGDFG